MTNSVKDNVKKRPTCIVCKRRFTVLNPIGTRGYKCPLCDAQERRENEAKKQAARREMLLESMWWLRD